jgi:hypothetical protein
LAALKGVPDTWYTRPTDIIANGSGDNANFYIPGTEPGAVSTNCNYYGQVPLPTQTCTYGGPNPAPTPAPSPTPGPSPLPSPTAGPTPPTH